MNHGYDVKRVLDEVNMVDCINQNLNSIKSALDILAAAIIQPELYTFMADGLNGTGKIALVPIKLPNGITPLYRALAGMRLVVAIDLTNATNLQTSFEQILEGNDTIRQLNSTNLSASSLLFILQG